jgi:methyl acetate hydrolase
MENKLKNTCDGILQQVTIGKPRVPGVVAMVTDRTANIYQGASGLRSLTARNIAP